MPVIWLIGAFASGAFGWAWLTWPEGDRETVWERITTNLGAAALAGAAVVAAVWIWRGRGR